MSRTLVKPTKPSFRQQDLPAWQPIISASTVLPFLFLIGIGFAPIGLTLLRMSLGVKEITLDYTDCRSIDNGLTCASIVSSSPPKPCKCRVDFELAYDIKKEVYAYYGLSNFYQNHRRYVRSRDDYQLLGNPKSVSSDCHPFAFANDTEGNLKPIAPCGAIANSKFNDTFELKMNDIDHNKMNILFYKQGIAWPSDKNIRFQNPPGESLKSAFEGTVKPPYWPHPVYNLSSNPENNGFQNEDLIVWMRSAALPTFRKIYGIVTIGKSNEIDHLPRGNYTLFIDYNYPVTMFNGRKRFILSNTSWIGGKNNFLGIAYIVVGCICFLISGFFLVIHRKMGRLPSEIMRINQSTPYLAS